MPINQQQLEARIANDLVNKYMEDLVWGDVVGAMQNAGPGDRQIILTGLKNRQFDKIGKALVKLVVSELLSQAAVESATMLVDEKLDMTEINRWLGDG